MLGFDCSLGAENDCPSGNTLKFVCFLYCNTVLIVQGIADNHFD
ncbi:hypothetical protein BTURTLESOX_1305 [bacterium endosymbiont of Bathymodiolus sp. 5 South]|nr:hypothetical protein BCLUESOX_1767 [bacterium endosymbiont of Bathymodiolus sp. 5 South]SSC08117.1 hypothetical protein BTURTLESOX_1305 [bacterium endosymbiont of Bathymodiolus sp. 5 South]VVH56846.1 hypothetical protein BSPCLSOX_244 [uncultured Gammaproteobacteria bacterium]